jgi:hypothetical protein
MIRTRGNAAAKYIHSSYQRYSLFSLQHTYIPINFAAGSTITTTNNKTNTFTRGLRRTRRRRDITRAMGTKPAPPVATLADAESSAIARSNSSKRDFIQIAMELSKARLSALVVMTTGAGSLFAGTTALTSGGTVAAAAMGTALCAASASTFNQAWEVKTDKLMPRTAQRPLPSGRVSTSEALSFGFGTGAIGTGILLAGCNPTTAALGLANIGLYSLVYTPMKLGTIRKLKDGKGLEFRYVQSFGKPILTCYSLFDVLTF